MESGQKSQSAVGRRAGLGAVLAAVLLTSACAAGQIAQTANEKPTLDGTEADIGALQLRGLAIEAPPAHPYYPKGADAQLTVVLINGGKRADRLTGISSSGFTGWAAFPTAAGAAVVQNGDEPGASTPAAPSAAPSSSSASLSSPGAKSVSVPVGSRVGFGTPEATGALLITKLKRNTYPGSSLRITFTFARAGSKTVTVPVQLTAGPNQSTIPGPSATGEQG